MIDGIISMNYTDYAKVISSACQYNLKTMPDVLICIVILGLAALIFIFLWMYTADKRAELVNYLRTTKQLDKFAEWRRN